LFSGIFALFPVTVYIIHRFPKKSRGKSIIFRLFSGTYKRFYLHLRIIENALLRGHSARLDGRKSINKRAGPGQQPKRAKASGKRLKRDFSFLRFFRFFPAIFGNSVFHGVRIAAACIPAKIPDFTQEHTFIKSQVRK